MKILVLTTSYPRHAGDPSGVFVANGVAALRDEGIELVVVSPAGFRHFGIAYGDGIVNNLRRAPWKVLLLPAFFASFAAAARRAERATGGVDVVHAHWLPSVIPALATKRPIVLQLWGSDAALAKRTPRLARRLLRRARVVLCASTALGDDAAALGAREVRLVPAGVPIPARVVEPESPPRLLFVGRLSEEKGVRELAEAAVGLPLDIVGDGPLRALFPQAQGFVAPAEVGAHLDRAAIVVVPSRREGYGMTAREAMAHGRPVVATDVGGLGEAIENGVSGILVPARDPEALRQALERLLDDEPLRTRLGAAARAYAERELSPKAAALATLAVLESASRTG